MRGTDCRNEKKGRKEKRNMREKEKETITMRSGKDRGHRLS